MESRLEAYFPPSVYPILEPFDSASAWHESDGVGSARGPRVLCSAYKYNASRLLVTSQGANCEELPLRLGVQAAWHVCTKYGPTAGALAAPNRLSGPWLYRLYPLAYPLLFRSDRKFGTVG